MSMFQGIKNRINNYKNRTVLKSKESHQFFDNYENKILPSTIKESKRHLVINEGHKPLFVRTIIGGVPPLISLSGYPEELTPRFMDEMQAITEHQISISFTVIPISNLESMKQIDRAEYLIRVEQQGYKSKNDINMQPPKKLEFELEQFDKNSKTIFHNEEGMFHTAFIVTLYADNIIGLDESESEVTTIMEGNGVYYEIPDYRHLDTFLASLPIPTTSDYTFCELFTNHITQLMATRNTNSHTDEDGLLVAQDLKTGRDIILDIHSLALSHIFLVAPSGWGKTFMAMLLAMRFRTQLRDRIIYITPKKEPEGGTNYRGTCEEFNGIVIDIGNGQYNINPLQILWDKETENENSKINIFDDHFDLLVKFFHVLFEGVTINMKSFLEETLIEAYRRKGIIRHIPETWENCNDWPTMIELRNIWEQIAKDPRALTAKALFDKSFAFTTSWDFLNQPTNINLDNDFIVIDLSNVRESLVKGLNVFVTGLMGLRFRSGGKKTTVLMVDEGSVFLRNQELSDFLLKTVTQGRSHKIILLLMCQQPSDVAKVGLKEEFLTNMPISIIGGTLQPKSISIVKDFFNLNRGISDELLSCNQGEGVLIIGSEQMTFKAVATEYEFNVIKGTKNKQIVSAADGIKLKNKSLIPLIQYGILLQDWIDSDDGVLQNYGYESKRIQNAIGAGLVRAWLKTDMLSGEMILNQSIDHYTTVIQICAYLLDRGIPAQINQLDGADVICEIRGKKYSFEYEHGTQSPEVLQAKKQNTNGGRLVFIGQSSNIKYLQKIVGVDGEDNVIKRGTSLANFLDDLIETAGVGSGDV